MNKVKLKFTKDYLIYHIIEWLLGGNLLQHTGITTLNTKNNVWKKFFNKKYNFLSIGNKYNSQIQIENDQEEIENYIYRNLEGQKLINMINFLYEEIFSLDIIPGNKEHFGNDYRGNHTCLFYNIVLQIDYKKLKVSEIDQLKEIITKNYKKSKVPEEIYNEVLRKLESKKEIAIKGF